jgi:DNA-binding transcriptional MerR regulator
MAALMPDQSDRIRLTQDEEDSDDGQRRGQKSDSAYRTISEVATDLNLPQHVLRFWESKFKQISPLKRAGGRRFYRPQDVDLIKRIHYLLYTQGYTIKGVQKLLSKDRHLLQSVPHMVGDEASVAVDAALTHQNPANDIPLPVVPLQSEKIITEQQPTLFQLENNRTPSNSQRVAELHLLLRQLKELRARLSA